MKLISTCVLLTLVSFYSIAQGQPEAVLEKADIDRYLSSGKQMMMELEAFEDSFDDSESEDTSYEEIIRSYDKALENNEAKAIIEKYGWEKNSFGKKLMAISMGATFLLTKKHMSEMPPEQQALMEEMFVKRYSSFINPDDLEILEPRLDELEAFFTNL